MTIQDKIAAAITTETVTHGGFPLEHFIIVDGTPPRRCASGEQAATLAAYGRDLVALAVRLAREPVEETGWRMLVEGEVMQDGDEHCYGGVWSRITGAIGTTWRSGRNAAVRRRIKPVEEAAPVPTMTREQAIEACARAARSASKWIRDETEPPNAATLRDVEATIASGGNGSPYELAVLAKSREPAIAAALAQTDERKGNVDAVAAAVARRQAFEEAIEIVAGACACRPRAIIGAIRARMAKP